MPFEDHLIHKDGKGSYQRLLGQREYNYLLLRPHKTVLLCYRGGSKQEMDSRNLNSTICNRAIQLSSREPHLQRNEPPHNSPFPSESERVVPTQQFDLVGCCIQLSLEVNLQQASGLGASIQTFLSRYLFGVLHSRLLAFSKTNLETVPEDRKHTEHKNIVTSDDKQKLERTMLFHGYDQLLDFCPHAGSRRQSRHLYKISSYRALPMMEFEPSPLNILYPRHK